MIHPIRRNQAYALRLLADLHTVPAVRRREIVEPIADDRSYAEARRVLDAVMERALAADASGTLGLARYFTAVDLIVDGWEADAEITDLVRTAVRAVVLHSDVEMRHAFRVLYAPLSEHVQFELLLIG